MCLPKLTELLRLCWQAMCKTRPISAQNTVFVVSCGQCFQPLVTSAMHEVLWSGMFVCWRVVWLVCLLHCDFSKYIYDFYDILHNCWASVPAVTVNFRDVKVKVQGQNWKFSVVIARLSLWYVHQICQSDRYCRGNISVKYDLDKIQAVGLSEVGTL